MRAFISLSLVAKVSTTTPPDVERAHFSLSLSSSLIFQYLAGAYRPHKCYLLAIFITVHTTSDPKPTPLRIHVL